MIAVVIPSRGRPDNVRRFLSACADPGARVAAIVVVDADDPTRDELAGDKRVLLSRAPARGRLRSSFARNVNAGVARAFRFEDVTHAIVAGDDMIPRTVGWADELAIGAGRAGLSFPDDGIERPDPLPTAVCWSRAAFRAVGFALPPYAMQHLYTDDYWRLLGTTAGALTYCASIELEHLHPAAGKAEDVDGSYAAVYSAEAWREDAAAWRAYRASPSFKRDTCALRRARRAARERTEPGMSTLRMPPAEERITP